MANLQSSLLRKNIAFVIGNGTSRLSANLSSLQNYGATYGCNAIYREVSLDHTVAVDVKMINEITESGFNNNHSVWTNKNKGVKSFENINVLDPHKGWSSGPTALWLATTHSYTEIYILGFDFQGVNGKVNNVYAGTSNYKKIDQPATFFGNWASQTERVIRENLNVIFYRVEGNHKFIPQNLHSNLKNLNHISYSELEQKFPNVTYTDKIVQKSTI